MGTPEEHWTAFIDELQRQFQGGKLVNFLGSIESYRRAFLLANGVLPTQGESNEHVVSIFGESNIK